MVLQYVKIITRKSSAVKFLRRNLHLLFLFVYIILVCRVMEACYIIRYFNYLYVLFLFLSGILLHKLYSVLKTKGWLKPRNLLITFSFLALIFIRNLKHLLPLWNYYIVQNFEAINKGIFLSTDTYFYQFLPFLIFLIPVTTAVCLAFYAKGSTEFPIIIILLYLFSFWNNGLDRSIGIYLPFFILISVLYYSIGNHSKLADKYKNTETKVTVSFREILLMALLFSVLITAVTIGSAYKLGTRSVFQLRSDYAVREAGLTGISRQHAYNVGFSGYGPVTGKLGGPILLDNSVAFRVKASRPVYLRGTVKDKYDGQSWSKAFNDYALKGLEALIVTNQDYNFKMSGNLKEKPKSDKITIFPERLVTSTLFSPANTISISPKGGKVIFDSAHAFLLMGKQAASEAYTLKYYVSSTGVESIDNIRDSRFGFSYNTDSSDTVVKLYESYLKVPPTITKRTYALVDSFTKDCKTTVDKVENIKGYLSRSYPYSLQVTAVPENTDFVDYFLFTEKKGYCTYFATAATMMCRIAGIPARYVEGFNMNDEKDSSGLYIVRNHRAHAWTEVLLSPESNLWTIVDCVPQGTPISEITDSSLYMGGYTDEKRISPDKWSDNTGEKRYNDDGKTDWASSFSLKNYLSIFIPVVLLLVLSAYIIYRLVKYNQVIVRLLAADSMIPYYKHLTARFAAMGESLPHGCGELEHAKSLADKELSGCLEIIVKACYLEYYGGIESNQAIDKKSCNSIIEHYILRKQGFLAYWYCRILKF